MNFFKRRKNQVLEVSELVKEVTPYKLKHEGIDLSKYSIAFRVAKVLECDVFDVIGIKDTDAKILALQIEILLNGYLVPFALAQKYKIYERFMLHSLSIFSKRVQNDSVFAGKVLLLQKEFDLA